MPFTDEYRIAYPDHRPSAGVSPVVTGLALQDEDRYRVLNQSIEDQSHRSGKTFLAIKSEDGRAMCAVLPMAASNIVRRVSPKMIAKVDVQVLMIEPEPLDQRQYLPDVVPPTCDDREGHRRCGLATGSIRCGSTTGSSGHGDHK